MSSPRIHPKLSWIAIGLLLGLTACVSPDNSPQQEKSISERQSQLQFQRALSGGKATVFADSRAAYSLPVDGLNDEQQTDFFVGNSFFNRNWVQAPASASARDGLGPLFNARSCSGCHLLDGRGRPPLGEETQLVSMLLRLSVPGLGAHGGVRPHPVYGDQLQNQAIDGVPVEGKVVIGHQPLVGTYPDGQPYELLKPVYSFTNLNYGELEGVLISPRTAPAMIGMGLLEAIPEAAILAHADPHDKNQDGISGRPNRVWNAKTQRVELGRFGWKANQPTVEQQVAGAFLGDIGITTRLNPDENCSQEQTACQQAEHGGRPELPEKLFQQVVFYSRVLAVPARRALDDPVVRQGELNFAQIGCDGCHLPRIKTGKVQGEAMLSNQTIQAFTDLLLHDMGEGLADGRPDFQANGREWRTAPLWGIGLVKTVNQHTRFLHDGRARNLEEAILWHGGEAQAAKQAFMNLPREQRSSLIAFLNSL